MAKLEELVVELLAETKDFRKEMNAAQKAAQKSSSFFKEVGQVALGNILAKGFEKAAVAGKKMFDLFVTQGIKAAQIQEDAVNRLNTALQNAGTFSQETSQRIQNFAAQLQNASTVGDETILGMVGLAQSFVKTAEDAEELTAAALDFSVGAGISFEEAVRRLGRGVQGASGDIANFEPRIRSLTKEQLENGEATRLIAERYKGAAGALTQTFSGAISQTSNSFRDLQEQIGALITDNRVVIEVVSEVKKIIDEWTASLAENKDANLALAGEGVSAAITAVSGFAEALDVILRTGTAFVGSIELIFARMGQFMNAPLAAFSKEAEVTWRAFKMQADAAANKINESINSPSTLGGMVEKLDRIQLAAERGLGAVSEAADIMTEKTRLQTEATRALTAAEMEKAEQGVMLSEELIENMEFENEERTRLMEERLQKERQLLDAALNAEKISKEKHMVAVDALEAKFAKKEEERRKKREKEEMELRQRQLSATSTLLNGVVDIARLGGRKTFQLAKRGAQAKAIVDAWSAINATLSFYGGTPIGVAAAAGVAASAFANVSRIESQGFQRGVASIPGIGTLDKFPATLAPREAVIDAGTNRDLISFLQAQKTGATNIGGGVSGTVRIEIDAGILAEAVRAEFRQEDFLNTTPEAV